MIQNIELKLLFGKPIDIEVGKIYSPKIEEIVEIGEEKYNQYLSILLYDVDLLDISTEKLKEMNIDKFTTYHFLLLQSYNDEKFKNMMIDALQYFFKERVGFDTKYVLFYLGEGENVRAIDFDNYSLFKKVLIKQNYLKEMEEEENLIFGNELAREWYLDIKRKEKMQPKPKNNIDLHSIISAVKWKGKRSFEEISEMTIYQLYDGYYRLSLIDSCDYLNQGIYHGTVNQKEIKQSDLSWAKIIKFDSQ
jgi:hypothetical protein